MIPVTKPFLPPIEKYQRYLHDVWQRNWLTNNGPLVNELELRLKEYLGVKHLLFVTNGTIAIQLAIKALGLTGEIITTPFSYVATASSVVWEGCTPVMVDIDKNTFNIDPNKIEDAITPHTSAILATHVYGNPCDIDAIATIAKQHKLKVIYDAAHAFGSGYNGSSVFNFGDISTASFHATKLFHTVEGGAVITQDPDLLKKLAFMRNFGHNGPEDFAELGINGKNSELHAAMGLTNLEYADEIIARRSELSKLYDEKLSGLLASRPLINPKGNFNYSYYPVLFRDEETVVNTEKALNLNWIYPRRYFYPLLSTLRYVNQVNLPVAEDISKRILCLPLYHTLTAEEIDFVCRIILRVQNN